jgi:G3E family GTPase
MLPICLVTGFLGTGKTTFLKNIVAHNRGRKIVYLINEFSAHDVDGAIVSAENPNVVSIPGGSIFCKCLVTEFIGQLSKLNLFQSVLERRAYRGGPHAAGSMAW